MLLGDKIKMLLKNYTMTKKELAKKLKFKDSSVISHWTSGRFYPSIQSKKKLAEVFAKPIEYFENDPNEQVLYDQQGTNRRFLIREKLENFPNIMNVGIIGNITGEKFKIETERTPSGYLPIFMEVYANKRIFAMKLESDCLLPVAMTGDYVIVEQAGYVESGELAMINLGNEYVLKRVFYSKNTITLKDIRHSKSLKLKKEDITIMGRVKGFFRIS